MKSWLDDELADGLKQGFLVGAAVLVLVLPHGRPGTGTATVALSTPSTAVPAVDSALARVGALPAAVPRPDFAGVNASDDAKRLARWVLAAGDNGGRAFVIIDKKEAQVFVFEPRGKLLGATPVLLGYAAGDDTVAGIGKRPIAEVLPEERTTPAGRFVSEPGRNALNEDVVWVDYDAAVSMHRVRLNNPQEHRLERLASPTTSDNRISYGCINMPVAFFDNVLWPNFRQQRGVIYVLPEIKSLTSVFPAMRDADDPVDHRDAATRQGV